MRSSRGVAVALTAGVLGLVSFLLPGLGAATAQAQTMGIESPSKAKATQGKAKPKVVLPAQDYQLREAHLRTEGGSFFLEIHSSAPWSHWTLGDPVRIVVDLGQTRSRLPNAPSLFEKVINRGVVKSFRTSQQVNSPLDRRVRLTLELSRVVPYQARRVGNLIQIEIPEAGVVGDWDLPILAPAEPEARLEIPEIKSPAPTAVDLIAGAAERRSAKPAEAAHPAGPSEEPEHRTASHAAPPVDAGEEPHAGLPVEHGTDHSMTTTTHVPAVPPASGVAAHDEEPTSRPPLASADAAKEKQRFQSLREALEAVVGKKNVQEITPEMARQSRTATPSIPDEPPPTIWGHEGDVDSLASEGGADGDSAHDETDYAATHDSVDAAAGHDAEDTSGEHGAETAAEDSTSGHAEAPAHGAGEGSRGPVPVSPQVKAMHAANAETIYREALRHWLAGSTAKAQKAIDRALRYYPHTEGGARCAFLARELAILNGGAIARTAEAPDAPAAEWFPDEAYQRLLAAHETKKNYTEVDRLFRDWGHLYPAGPWRGRLQWVLGQHFVREGRNAEGVAHLEAIENGDAYEARAQLLLAQLEEEAGDDAAALERYSYLAMLPSSAWQVRGLARAADLEFQDGDLGQALTRYEDLLNAGPPPDETSWALYQVGNCLLLMGDAQGARLRYDDVVKRFPQSFWAPFAQERMEALAWNTELAKSIEATFRP
ncbi:MAG: AMIN domain-containing protein [Candidatus Eisenbacteria bacterium]|nr:AMIN domain-containing protein [Candidatus Eisenbacteria bacterium]